MQKILFKMNKARLAVKSLYNSIHKYLEAIIILLLASVGIIGVCLLLAFIFITVLPIVAIHSVVKTILSKKATSIVMNTEIKENKQ